MKTKSLVVCITALFFSSSVFAVTCKDTGKLFSAAWSGNRNVISDYAAAKCSLDVKDARGFTLYDIAAINGNSDLMKWLVANHGAREGQFSPAMIKYVQTGLRYINIDAGVINGKLTAQTVEAIKKYQKSVGVSVNGKINHAWLPSFSKKIIKQVQSDLDNLGYNVGAPDGILGSGTRNAMQSFRAKKKIAQPNYTAVDDQLIYQLMLSQNDIQKEVLRKKKLAEAEAAKKAQVAKIAAAKAEAERKRVEAEAKRKAEVAKAEAARKAAEKKAREQAKREELARENEATARLQQQAIARQQTTTASVVTSSQLAQQSPSITTIQQTDLTRQRAVEEQARQAELARQRAVAEQARQAELAQRAVEEQARQAELARQRALAEQARQAELARQKVAQAEVQRQAEAAAKAAEAERTRAAQAALAKQTDTFKIVSTTSESPSSTPSRNNGSRRFNRLSGTLTSIGGSCMMSGKSLPMHLCQSYAPQGSRECTAVIAGNGDVMSMRCTK